MLEELLAKGYAADYDAWYIDINEGDQFSSGFVDVNPNSKIPALFDKATGVRVFESGAILFSNIPINRFAMEAKRQLDVLNQQLEENRYIAGAEYTIADMATAPWYGSLVKGAVYDAAEFLDTASYENVNRWADDVMSRPAYQKGRMVNRGWGEEHEQLRERHDVSDFDSVPKA
ncbi:Disulfide-bond oxidoreductase YghU [Nymphon striatum]|nr:Disulfide-bond oxidoreductase YghU [Nymphon striatum]